MDNFIDNFREEAFTLLAEMEGSILKLDVKKDDKVLVDEVFRVMHTLKGTSAMFGFDNIGKLTHHLENIYDLARERKFEITEQVLNITLEITDFIKIILNNPDDKTQSLKVNEFIIRLESIMDKADINELVENAKEGKSDNKLYTYYIVFNPTERILFRGINLLTIFKELSGLGKYKIIHHKFSDAESEKDNKNVGWGIYLVTSAEISEIEEVYLFVNDNCKIVKVADFDVFKNEDVIKELKNIESGNNDEEKSQSLMDIVNSISVDSANSYEEQQEDMLKLGNKNQNVSENKRISVNSDKLDRLMNLVSDLVTSNAILTMASKTKDFELLENVAEKFERLTRQFRDNALSIRLVSIKELLLRFKRLVRDLSKELGKDVQFVIEGEETEMDKNIIDNLSEPLVHIFRNAIDHGIESPNVRKKSNKNKTGIIKLSAFYSGAYVYIAIQDDGRGIDKNAVLKKAISKGFISKDSKLTDNEIYGLLFKPGFSTAQKVSDVSGRGVGLDVVKNKIAELQGEIEVNSEVGLGTTFTIKLQQTISIIDTLLIRSASSLYLIPQNNIEFCIEEDYSILFKELNKRVVYEDEVIPFINLRDLFNNKTEIPKKAKLVIVNKNNFRYAIAADEIIGEHQAVVKPLGNILRKQEYFTGVSLLGDGSLAFMIDLMQMQDYFKSRSFAHAV